MAIVRHTSPTPHSDCASSRKSVVVIVSVSESFLPVLIEVRVEHGQVKVLHPGYKFSARFNWQWRRD
jgi:hypothetical protein